MNPAGSSIYVVDAAQIKSGLPTFIHHAQSIAK